MGPDGRKYLPLLFFALMLIIGLVHNNSISLWDQDEAAYAGFARTMVNSGNWLIPEFMWSDHHRKPPLHFWNIALAYKLFGINEFSVRLPAALSVFGTYLLMFFWGGRLFGRPLAFLSTVILSTTYFTPLLSKLSVTDATLLFTSAICAFSVIELVKFKSRWSILSFWAAFSLALLTKGPPVVLFCGVFTGILVLFHPQRKHLIALHPWFFLPLAMIPLMLWGYFASLQDGGELIRWMIDFYILQRVDGAVMGQSLPPGFHLLMILGFFTPYLMFLPEAVRQGFSGRLSRSGDLFLLFSWFIAGWLLYEFSATKLPAYTIVAHVAFAFLVGKAILNFAAHTSRPAPWLVLLHYAILLLVAAGLIGAAFFLELSPGLKTTFILWAILLIAALFVVHRQKGKRYLYGIIGINLFFQCLLWIVVLPQADRYKDSSRQIGQFLSEHISSTTTVVIGNNMGHPPSLPFYAGKRGNKVEEVTDPEALWELAESDRPLAFILSFEQKEYLLQKDNGLSFRSFESFFVDRKGKASYYVLLHP